MMIIYGKMTVDLVVFISATGIYVFKFITNYKYLLFYFFFKNICGIYDLLNILYWNQWNLCGICLIFTSLKHTPKKINDVYRYLK